MNNDTWRSRTDDWSQIDTEAMARINPEAATMARLHAGTAGSDDGARSCSASHAESAASSSNRSTS